MSTSRSRQRRLRLGALLALTLFACLPPSASTGARRPGKTMNEISRAEIEPELFRFSTAYDLVRVLRPGMLVPRQPMRETRSAMPIPTHGIKVYVDGFLYGGVGSLATIPASSVIEIRWLSAIDATTRYGTGHTSGAIMVTTRAGPR